VVAIIALFHLWFTRERAMYWGRDVVAEQQALFKYIGFPKTILEGTYKIQGVWPETTRYSMSGDLNLLSYPVYLLLPRVPAGDSVARLVLGSNTTSLNASYLIINPEARPAYRIAINSVNNSLQNKPAIPTGSSFYGGLFLAVLSILGVTLFLRVIILKYLDISFPETFSIAILATGIVVVLSKYSLHSIKGGLILTGVVSILGWISLVFGKEKDSRYPWNLKENYTSLLDRTGFFISVASLTVVCGMLVWSFMKSIIVGPDVWDCWTIWGAKAKMMALGDGSISDAILISQRDYPLLWPALWAFTGGLAGGWEDHWSKGWGPILMLICVLEIAVIVTRETKRRDYGMLAGAVFISVPAVPLVASWGYAEPVLWCMITCSFGMLLQWYNTRNSANLVLAGILAAGSAVTKNEGLVFVGLSLLWISVNSRINVKHMLFFILPVIVIYAPWFGLLRVVSGAQYDSMPPLLLSADELISKASHLWPALKVAVSVWSDFKQWTFVLWGLSFGMIICIFRGGKFVRLNLMIPLLMIVASMVTIVLRNENFEWQVGAAWNRLTIQVLPLIIIAVFCEYAGRGIVPYDQAPETKQSK